VPKRHQWEWCNSFVFSDKSENLTDENGDFAEVGRPRPRVVVFGHSPDREVPQPSLNMGLKNPSMSNSRLIPIAVAKASASEIPENIQKVLAFCSCDIVNYITICTGGMERFCWKTEG
jgi:hypothetical protein